MTFDDIRNQCYEGILGYSTGTIDARVTTYVNRRINRWHRQILSAPGFRSLRKTQVTQASVADTFDYGIQLEEIHHITERTTNRRLTKRTEDWWRTHFPDPTQFTGTPEYWVPLGYTRTLRRPANASEIFVISTSASDTGTAYVEFIRSGGYPRSLSVTMTGVTGVSLATAITDVVDVIDFFVSAAAVGTITLREDSGTGTVLSQIAIGQSYPRFLRYALAPTPSAAITYYHDGVAPIVDMAQTTDRPLIQDDFHDILVDGPVYEYLRAFGGKNRALDASELKAQTDRRIAELRAWVWMQQVQAEGDDRHRPDPEETITLPLT